MERKDDLDESLRTFGWLDFIFFIPFSLLFYYLPSDHWWQFLINVIIMILSAVGTAHIVYIIKKKKAKRGK
ncbi:DUF6007 family protein [Staphylococcus canis]|uniref:Uncharacterized protein n=1 Tax=Staphylococcus canis TaxID=2724942 RepID=A0ABS0T805_9STAP|nr:DUF6007 family protein [Staphylococcus canis]MBI5974879.1 hypothetical protein [Staphylococcus canis]